MVLDANVRRWVVPLIAGAVVVGALGYLEGIANFVPATWALGKLHLGKILLAGVAVLLANEITKKM